jgi:uncharacterized protein (TIGR00725 family)
MKIAVIGSARKVHKSAYYLGQELGRCGHQMLTGACGGTPGAATQGSLDVGGAVLGYSPGTDAADHLRYGMGDRGTLPTVYTGRGVKGRNISLMCDAEATIVIGGQLGTLHEAITFLEEREGPLYYLWSSGGTAFWLWFILFAIRKDRLRNVRFAATAANLLREVLADAG